MFLVFLPKRNEAAAKICCCFMVFFSSTVVKIKNRHRPRVENIAFGTRNGRKIYDCLITILTLLLIVLCLTLKQVTQYIKNPKSSKKFIDHENFVAKKKIEKIVERKRKKLF